MESQRFQEIQLSNTTLDTNFVPTGGIGLNGWIYVNDLFAWTLAFAWTGTPVGNFVLEGTDAAVITADANGATGVVAGSGITVAANKIFVISGTTQAAGGAAGKFVYERLTPGGFRFIRLNYQFGSSTGTLTYEDFNGTALRDA